MYTLRIYNAHNGNLIYEDSFTHLASATFVLAEMLEWIELNQVQTKGEITYKE